MTTETAGRQPVHLAAGQGPAYLIGRLALTALIAWMPAWASAMDKITLTAGDWRPYLAHDAAQHGVIARVVSEAFALEGVQVTYTFSSWTRAYSDAEQGRADGSVIWIEQPERAEKFHYSEAVFEARTVLFHLKESKFDWNGITDLYGRTVGGTVGYMYQFEPNPNIRVDRGPNDEAGFRKLLGKRFPVFISDLAAGQAVLNQHFTDAEVQRVTFHPRPLKITSYHLILPKKLARSPQLLERFNRGLKRLRDSGRYQELLTPLQLSLEMQFMPAALSGP
jgi:polar amino acid transport system substrate-binding protein